MTRVSVLTSCSKCGVPGTWAMNRPVVSRGLADPQTSNAGNWVDNVIEPCRRPGRRHTSTVTRWIGKDGRRKVRGIPGALTESAAYPRRLGQRIYACHTGQYSASARRRAAQPRQRQQKITKGNQQLTTSSPARSAKMWLQPRASIDLLRPASSIPWPVRATAVVPKSKDWLHPGANASSSWTTSSRSTRCLWSQPSSTGGR